MSVNKVKSLFELELFQSVIETGNLMITVADRNPDVLQPIERYQLIAYCAKSHLKVRCFKKAEQLFFKALHLYKDFGGIGDDQITLSTIVTQQIAGLEISGLSEIELKYELFLCFKEQSNYSEALGVLETISPEHRSPKVLSSLALIYRQLHKAELAKRCYSELLVQVPTATDVAIELLKLGVSFKDFPAEVQKSMHENFVCPSIFSRWIEAQTCLATCQYQQAASLFKEIDNSTVLSNNTSVLSALARCHYGEGDYPKAANVWLRVHNLDCYWLDGMDILSFLLYEEGRYKELESLANRLADTKLFTASHRAPQRWIAMGYLCRSRKKVQRALYFAQKACTLSVRPSVEALLLKGRILIDSGKAIEASLHFREAQAQTLDYFEIYQAHVQCLLLKSSTNQARSIALSCVSRFNKSARSLALLASVYTTDSTTLGKAQTCLEQAVAKSPHLVSAVYELLDIYERRKLYDKAVKLLREQTTRHAKSELHKRLGDFLLKLNNPNEAMTMYREALSLNPGDDMLRQSLMQEMEEELSRTPVDPTPDDSITPMQTRSPPVPVLRLSSRSSFSS